MGWSYLKILLYMLLGFAAPVGLSLYVYSSFIRDIPVVESLASAHAPEQERSFASQDLPMQESDQSKKDGYFAIASDLSLDPQPQKTFFTAVQFSLDELPAIAARQKIIAKYETIRVPYSGWAMAITRNETSSRPTLYWKGTKGRGKWFAFGDVQLEVNKSYEFSVVVTSKRQVMGFWKEIGDSGDSRLKFLGGYDMAKIELPSSSAPLYFGVKGGRESSFRGTVQRVVVASLDDQLVSRQQLQEMLQSPLAVIAEQVKANDLYLHVDPSGKDLSSYARKVALSENS